MLTKTGMRQLRLIVCHVYERVWTGLQEELTAIYQTGCC